MTLNLEGNLLTATLMLTLGFLCKEHNQTTILSYGHRTISCQCALKMKNINYAIIMQIFEHCLTSNSLTDSDKLLGTLVVVIP